MDLRCEEIIYQCDNLDQGCPEVRLKGSEWTHNAPFVANKCSTCSVIIVADYVVQMLTEVYSYLGAAELGHAFWKRRKITNADVESFHTQTRNQNLNHHGVF